MKGLNQGADGETQEQLRVVGSNTNLHAVIMLTVN